MAPVRSEDHVLSYLGQIRYSLTQYLHMEIVAELCITRPLPQKAISIMWGNDGPGKRSFLPDPLTPH